MNEGFMEDPGPREPGIDPLIKLLTSEGTPSELAGEAGALAMFRAARRHAASAAAPPPTPPRTATPGPAVTAGPAGTSPPGVTAPPARPAPPCLDPPCPDPPCPAARGPPPSARCTPGAVPAG